ncbi:MAG TPA: isoprenylcysteine carboxylmethyltransferase family protein [Phenylobacterium sp.]|jgi:methyltransferase|uniref:isoprenylcysteine carboxyl methyltransferase family protein n=1 Tax=Phenylobacterium sp. TaxID=1871053 RepID=UPI002D5BBAB3|nr:isoprenylcysteine carboxylmethyltransferase family protein [Phenylobacterium sp.]HZZ67253.1 isoprenylcysteine carboxylmethyltransferase family protein [Phenylobacterium sp.]
MILSIAILTLVTAQRLGELVVARRNTRRLLAQGGVERGAQHYPLMVALHAAWLGGLWLLAWNRPANLWWLMGYILLEALRVWVLMSIGRRWTTRIIVVPGESLVRRGPYRLIPHPNYAVVVGEIAVLPLAFGLVGFAVVFSLLNAAMLWLRIRTENHALAGAATGAAAPQT